MARKCEHGKHQGYCRTCYPNTYCIHDRVKYVCKECGGSQLCIHKEVKSKCRECSGSAICEHGHHKIYCQKCGGSVFCDHHRERRRCIFCTPRGAYQQLLNGAKRREINFDLTFEQFDRTVHNPCTYCGDTFEKLQLQADEVVPSIDRWNNALGYTSENSVSCCSTCNFMKRCMSAEAFRKHCQKVVIYAC
jgi:hypothetical protein